MKHSRIRENDFSMFKKSKKYLFDYIEIDKNNSTISTQYDLYFFNYHQVTMSWLSVKNL
jgi:hypothetical protein